MDLATYGRVLRRFWPLLLGGAVLAAALAVLSVARISSNGLTYRSHEIWKSESTVLLSQKGFPFGRAVVTQNAQGVSPYADPSRLSSLTDLYSSFANSDAVKQIMRQHGAPKAWSVIASPVVPSIEYGILPVVAIDGTAFTPGQALKATALARQAFLQYVTQQENTAGISTGQRIDLSVLQSTTPPTLLQGRKKTLPIVIIIAVMTAAIGLAFVLENLRPRAVSVTRVEPSGAIQRPAATASSRFSA